MVALDEAPVIGAEFRRAPQDRRGTGVAPSGSSGAMDWDDVRVFLAVARHFDADLGIQPLFIGGPADDLSPFGAHECLQGASLEEVKSLIAGATLFIGNDSGPAHIAAAFGRPVIILWGASDIDNWHPWRTENVVLRSPQGIHSIPVSEVAAAIETLARQPV